MINSNQNQIIVCDLYFNPEELFKLKDHELLEQLGTQGGAFKLVSINVSRFDANKHMASSVIGDAKVSLNELSQALGNWKAPDAWHKKSVNELKSWNEYVDKESGPTNQKLPSELRHGLATPAI